jgi:hypothetical protein
MHVGPPIRLIAKITDTVTSPRSFPAPGQYLDTKPPRHALSLPSHRGPYDQETEDPEGFNAQT